MVSALRGNTRMDYCGDASRQVVYFSPDNRQEELRSFLTTPGAGPGRTDAVTGDLEGSVAWEETTSLKSGATAARHFATTGEADQKLTWFTSPEIFDRRPSPS